MLSFILHVVAVLGDYFHMNSQHGKRCMVIIGDEQRIIHGNAFMILYVLESDRKRGVINTPQQVLSIAKALKQLL